MVLLFYTFTLFHSRRLRLKICILYMYIYNISYFYGFIYVKQMIVFLLISYSIKIQFTHECINNVNNNNPETPKMPKKLTSVLHLCCLIFIIIIFSIFNHRFSSEIYSCEFRQTFGKSFLWKPYEKVTSVLGFKKFTTGVKHTCVQWSPAGGAALLQQSPHRNTPCDHWVVLIFHTKVPRPTTKHGWRVHCTILYLGHDATLSNC